MNERRNHTRHYTYSDIKHYIDGKMSLDEMYAFEKAIMDDPFLAEALEGYMALKQRGEKETVREDLKDLGDRINKKSAASARGFVYPLWLKSVAAIALLVFLGYLADQFILKKTTGPGEIAKKEVQAPVRPNVDSKKENPASIPDTVKISPENRVPNEAKSEVQGESGDKINRKTEKPADNQPNEANKEALADRMSPTAGKKAEAQPPHVADEEKLNNKDLALKPRPLAAAAMAANDQLFRGVIIDANSMPVQGAAIKLANGSKTVTTNKQGEFDLDIGHKESKINLEVNALGYRSRVIEVAPDELGRNIIELSPDSSSVKEIVISEFRTKQIKESNVDFRNSVDLNASLATPTGGWPSFYDYLNRNKKINTVDSSKKGTEIISFQVDKNGKLSSFRAEQSISKAHHAEAIRLIKEGPAWTCLKDKKQRITIYINFN